MFSDCAFDLEAAKQAADTWRRNYRLLRSQWRDLNITLDNTRAELSGVRSDLEDTTKTLDKYREMHVKRSRANSELRKSVADLNEALEMRTEERDLARELFKAMMNEYADLLDRYSILCDAYEAADRGKF